MVLSMNTPEEATFEALHPVIPVFVSYLLSFVYVGIYWINHHQILQIAQCINGKNHDCYYDGQYSITKCLQTIFVHFPNVG